MKKCIIIAAGSFKEKTIKKEKGDLLIVADAGYKNFKKLNNLSLDDIDIIIGDFDSMKLEKMDLSKNTKIIKLNPIKDESDSFSAVKEALSLGYKEFYLYGVLGKRIEHSLSNISILIYLKYQGAKGCIKDKDTIIEVLHNEKKVFDSNHKGYISILPINDCKGVEIKGLKYELNDAILDNYHPSLGLDNEFLGKEASISLKEGMLLLIYRERI